MNKQKVATIAGLVVIACIVLYSPFERQAGEFSKVLRQWGSEQQEVSENVASTAVSDLEGTVVGEHQINGANWSIPNIIRHFLGVD